MKNLFLLTLLMGVLLTGCKKEPDPQPQPTVDPSTIVEGTYMMTYLASGTTAYSFPLNTASGTVAGSVSFAHLTGTNETFTLTLTLNGSVVSSQSGVVYITGLNQTTVTIYNDAALTFKIGTATRNSINIDGTDASGARLVLRASR